MYCVDGIPWVNSGELQSMRLSSVSHRLPKNTVKDLKMKVFPTDTLVMAIYGLEAKGVRGKSSFLGVPACISQSCMAFLPKANSIDVLFIYFFLKAKKDILGVKYAQGTKQQNLTSGLVETFKFCFPSLKEQRRIGFFLELIERRIEAQSKIIEEKERLIKVLNDRLYEEAPKKRIRFSKISSSFNGLSGKSAEDFGTGYPFVTYLSILKNHIIPNEGFGYVSVEENECQNLLKYGDTLLTLSSETPEEVGVASVYLGELTPLYLNSFSLGLRFNDFSFIDPQYAPWLFATSAFRKHIFPFAQGSTRYNLNVPAFMNSEFEIPNLEDQQAFSRLIGALATEIETNRKVLQEFRRAKKYLLSAMFI